VGGAQENTVASVLGLQKKPGLTVNLIAGPTTGPEGSLEPLLHASPNTLQLLPELVRPVHPWKDAVALYRLTRHFLSRRPDIVHTHSGKAGILGRIAARQNNPDAFVLFERAVRIVRERGLPRFEEAVTLQAYADAERRRGNEETAGNLLQKARDIYDELGIRHLRRRWVDLFGPVTEDDAPAGGVREDDDA
jgi:hypothetical protein